MVNFDGASCGSRKRVLPLQLKEGKDFFLDEDSFQAHIKEQMHEYFKSLKEGRPFISPDQGACVCSRNTSRKFRLPSFPGVRERRDVP